MSIFAQHSVPTGGKVNLFNLIEDGMSRRVRVLVVLYVLVYRILGSGPIDYRGAA
mgnify:CR=1 FL=1